MRESRVVFLKDANDFFVYGSVGSADCVLQYVGSFQVFGDDQAKRADFCRHKLAHLTVCIKSSLHVHVLSYLQPILRHSDGSR